MKPLRHVYQVGGCVRDALLGLSSPDRDWLVVGETIQTMQARGFVQVGAAFPVFLHPETGEEYALARQERKRGQGYRGFSAQFSRDTTLEQDLARRDLTINAMAMDASGSIIDPFGGQKDLQQRLLRHVSPAFAEDPLRVLRVARFLARFWSLGFRVVAGTLQLLKQLVDSGEIQTLTAERVWLESHKALQTDHPLVYFDLLQQCGALPVLFPELAQLQGVPQSVIYHPEGDVWRHTRLVLMQATQLSRDPAVRFAALVHDLGKGITPQDLLPHHYGHEERGVLLVQQLCDRLRIPNTFRKLSMLVTQHHMHCHRLLEMSEKKVVRLLQNLNAFRHLDFLEKYLLACQADAQGRFGREKKPYSQASFLRQCLQQCQGIDNQKLLQNGYQGRQFADALHKERIRQVRAVLKP